MLVWLALENDKITSLKVPCKISSMTYDFGKQHSCLTMSWPSDRPIDKLACYIIQSLFCAFSNVRRPALRWKNILSISWGKYILGKTLFVLKYITWHDFWDRKVDIRHHDRLAILLKKDYLGNCLVVYLWVCTVKWTCSPKMQTRSIANCCLLLQIWHHLE